LAGEAGRPERLCQVRLSAKGRLLGCRVAQKVLEITVRPETLANVENLSGEFGHAFRKIAAEDAYLAEIRQCGVIFGLRFDHPAGALYMQRELYDRGVWAIASGYDESVLQFRPGLLLEREAVGDILERIPRRHGCRPRTELRNRATPADGAGVKEPR
jgi:acetylornithine/succinyldiaminopimelate/putrescine aminotransferase